MVGQYEELSCSFCDKGVIRALHVAGAWSVKRSGTRSLPGKQTVHRSADEWLIQSGCGACGKTPTEAERKLKDEGII